jgi:hypothetical protein
LLTVRGFERQRRRRVPEGTIGAHLDPEAAQRGQAVAGVRGDERGVRLQCRDVRFVARVERAAHDRLQQTAIVARQ